MLESTCSFRLPWQVLPFSLCLKQTLDTAMAVIQERASLPIVSPCISTATVRSWLIFGSIWALACGFHLATRSLQGVNVRSWSGASTRWFCGTSCTALYWESPFGSR